jgi:hypothetical protein
LLQLRGNEKSQKLKPIDFIDVPNGIRTHVTALKAKFRNLDIGVEAVQFTPQGDQTVMSL